jgi:uncharacterized protein (DUF305 family)
MEKSHSEKSLWVKLGFMTLASFVAMYFLMYSMVNSYEDIYLSINQIYMAGSMAAAMIAIELLVMGEMYRNRLVRNVLIGVGILMTLVFVLFTRYQTAIDDKDFLRSMIPHHSGAILMCSNPRLSDPEILKLCEEIIASQKAEIDQMKAIKARLTE